MKKIKKNFKKKKKNNVKENINQYAIVFIIYSMFL